jgi:hypothetical protein
MSLHGLVTFDLKHVPDELPVLLVIFDDKDQLICHKSSDNSPAKALRRKVYEGKFIKIG